MIRATSMATAFVDAAVKVSCNPEKGVGLWTARRTLLNAQRPGFAVVVDRPQAQTRPRIPFNREDTINSVNSFKRDAQMDTLVQELADVFLQTHLKLSGPARSFLSDEEILGLD